MKYAIKAIALIVAATALVGTASGLGAGAERSGGTAVAYNVKLGKNGGAGGDDCVTVTFGKPMPTPCAAPKRAFWTFDGYWDTVKTDEKGNPIGKQYYNAKMKSVRNWDKTSATTLWAKWTSNFALSKIMSDWASISYFAMAILMVMFVAGGVCGGEGHFHPLEISDGTSSKLRNMAFVCSILVVLLHATLGYKNPASGTVEWWLYFSTVRICQMAVPAFFLLSGFFLAGHVDRPGWYRSAVSKRVRTLLVPFVIWSLIWVAYLFCRTVLSNAFCSRFVFTGFQRWMDSSAYLGLNPTQHPLLGPLWYVRGLLFLVVLCPVFLRMLSRCKWLVLVCALLACLFRPGYLDCAGNISYTLYFFLGFSGLFCFLVGISIRLGYIKMPGRALMIIIGCLGAGIICASNALSSMHFMGASDRIALVRALREFNNVPFLFCLVWVLIPSRRWPSWLTSMSFPIYLVHWFVMDLHDHLFVDRIETFGQMFFKAGFMVLGSLGIVAILRLLPRKAYEVLFGGR